MKTAPGVGNVELVEIAEPACPPDGVKVEVRYTGICGTDLHVYHDTFRNYPPVILGHEFSGVVVEAGKEIRSVRPGARVAVLGSTAVSCGSCEHCRQGFYMFCSSRRGMGHGVSGSMTRYVVVREDQVYALPDSVSFEEGAVCEPFACAVQAVDELTTSQAGDIALVSGPGPIGLLCAMLLAARGVRVLLSGTDQDEARLKMAPNLGLYRAINVSRENLQDVVSAETGGRGVDIVVEAAGAPPSVVACLKAVRSRGAYVQIGIYGADMTIPFDLVLYKQLKVVGSMGHSLTTWDRVMRIIGQGTVDLKSIVTHIMPLSQWREAFDLCENKGAVKALLHYDDQ